MKHPLTVRRDEIAALPAVKGSLTDRWAQCEHAHLLYLFHNAPLPLIILPFLPSLESSLVCLPVQGWSCVVVIFCLAVLAFKCLYTGSYLSKYGCLANVFFFCSAALLFLHDANPTAARSIFPAVFTWAFFFPLFKIGNAKSLFHQQLCSVPLCFFPLSFFPAVTYIIKALRSLLCQLCLNSVWTALLRLVCIEHSFLYT